MDLHYSQTINAAAQLGIRFHYLMDLHYSQTHYCTSNNSSSFHYLMDLHYSQTYSYNHGVPWSFTTLWIYTILKHLSGFNSLSDVSLPYGFTLFSNHYKVYYNATKFHYLMDLHYSQTRRQLCPQELSFTTLWIYTILKPQISCAHYAAQGKSTRSSTIVLWRNGIVKGTQIPIQHIEFGAHIYARRCLAL